MAEGKSESAVVCNFVRDGYGDKCLTIFNPSVFFISGFDTNHLGKKTSVVVRIKMLTDIETRGDNLVCYVIDSITKNIKEMYIPSVKRSMVKKGNFYIISDVGIGSAINVKDYSKIMVGAAFEYEKSLEKDFLNPKNETVPEALASPEKKRLNLTGVLNGVSDILVTSKSKRRILYVQPDTDVSLPICEVKLWGDKTGANIPSTSSRICVSNLEMRSFKGKMDGNSTNLTEITVVDEKEEEINGEVEGACFEVGSIGICLESRMYDVSSEIIGQIFPSKEFIGNTEVRVKVKGNTVVQLISRNTAKKMKKH